MNIIDNKSLAPYTSLGVGGEAEKLIEVESYDEMLATLKESAEKPWLLGFGCNVLISDQGLTGTAIVWRNGDIVVKNTDVTVDGGVWWDDFAKTALAHNLWGVELMSDIPSSIAGAIYGNIAAYGQQVSDTLDWVEVYDFDKQAIVRLNKTDIEFGYRWSSLQNQPNLAILKANFKLSQQPTIELKYDSALAIAEELGVDSTTLDGRRKIILETRKRAGSIYHPGDKTAERTAGSFFKNPLVSTDLAKTLAAYDETGKTLERIENQSRIHGGDSHRASAAHILLAAGFKRGQSWGTVRLHPSHVLKVEALDGATATDIYKVVQEIIETVQQKLGIELEPEVKFLGF